VSEVDSIITAEVMWSTRRVAGDI